MNEKIKEINKLQSNIEELKDFIHVLDRGNTISTHSTKTEEKMNEFSYMYLGAYIWTGSQSPEYEKKITNRTLMNKFKSSMIEIAKQELEIMELTLKVLIN